MATLGEALFLRFFVVVIIIIIFGEWCPPPCLRDAIFVQFSFTFGDGITILECGEVYRKSCRSAFLSFFLLFYLMPMLSGPPHVLTCQLDALR